MEMDAVQAAWEKWREAYRASLRMEPTDLDKQEWAAEVARILCEDGPNTKTLEIDIMSSFSEAPTQNSPAASKTLNLAPTVNMANNPPQTSNPYVGPRHKVAPIQTTDRVREVVRGDGTMSDLLFDLISDASPHGHEEPVRNTLKAFMKKLGIVNYTDKCGNLLAQIGKIGEHGSKTMFSSHMDTVHGRPFKVVPMITTGKGPDADYVYGASKSGNVQFVDSQTGHIYRAGELPQLFRHLGIEKFNPSIKTIEKDAKGNQQFCVQYKDKGVTLNATNVILTKYDLGFEYTAEVLGADDKLGCYIMCKLLEAKVPGLYVFHVGEEVGGVGSNWIADHSPEVVKGMERCVAFDRHQYEDIITCQAGGRSASDAFAQSLADQLNAFMPPMNTFAPSANGVFTDSANYTGLIAECTNLSVGYFKQHWENEHFDLQFLEHVLIPALLKVEWEKLPTVRVPGTYESKYGKFYGTSSNSKYTSYADSSPPWEDYNLPDLPNKAASKKVDVSSLKISGGKKSKGKPVPKKPMGYTERNIDKVPAGNVTSKTPLDLVPDWVPEDGLLWGVSAEGMQIIIAKWIVSSNQTARHLAGIMFELMEDYENVSNELDAYQLDEMRGNG